MDVEGSNSEDVNIKPKAVGKKTWWVVLWLTCSSWVNTLFQGKTKDLPAMIADASSWEGYWQEVRACDHGLPGSDVWFIRSKADKTASSPIPNWKRHLRSTQQGAEKLKPALGGLKYSDASAKWPKFQAAKPLQAIQFDGKWDFSHKNEVSEIT
jgi:hypothetical protein